MHFFPSMDVFVSLGVIDIKWQAILLVISVIIGYLLAAKKLKKAGIEGNVVDDILLSVIFYAIVVARIVYCLTNDFSSYLANPISIINITDNGLALSGALIGGVSFLYFYCKKHNLNLVKISDVIASNLFICQIFISLANYFNQTNYGLIVKESYFDGLLLFLRDGMYIDYRYREPLFLYEIGLYLVGYLLINLFSKTRSNKLATTSYSYLSWLGLVRVFIELKKNDLVTSLTNMSLWFGLMLVIFGVYKLLGERKNETE